MHQVFNICWQMVSCWFVLLILYLLNLDICEKAKCIVFIGLFWWRDTFNLYILYTNASKGIYIRDLQQENINKWLRPGSRLLFGIFVINLHISTSNQIGWLTAIVKNGIIKWSLLKWSKFHFVRKVWTFSNFL